MMRADYLEVALGHAFPQLDPDQVYDLAQDLVVRLVGEPRESWLRLTLEALGERPGLHRLRGRDDMARRFVHGLSEVA